MSNITQRILKKIKEKHVEKIPRWRFVFKRILIWTALIAAVILASFAVSMILFQLIDVDWDLLPKVAPVPFFGVMKLIPYFWLIVAGLLFTFVYFDFKNIKGGYRYGGFIIIIGSLIVALIVGVCIYFLQAPRNADDLFFRKMPMYRQMHMGREMMWNVPDMGVLAGTVLEVREDKAFILEDFGENVWTVDISKVKEVDFIKIFVGMRVKVVGKIEGPGRFVADFVRGGGRMIKP